MFLQNNSKSRQEPLDHNRVLHHNLQSSRLSPPSYFFRSPVQILAQFDLESVLFLANPPLTRIDLLVLILAIINCLVVLQELGGEAAALVLLLVEVVAGDADVVDDCTNLEELRQLFRVICAVELVLINLITILKCPQISLEILRELHLRHVAPGLARFLVVLHPFFFYVKDPRI